MRPNILLACATTAFEAQSNDSTLYRKEVVYPGHFVKKTETGEIEFELPVDDALISHWVATFNRMKRNGVEVPLPIEHTSDPESRRGTVERLTKEFNPERGVDCLYAYVRFRDKKTGDALSKTTQVSLFSPPDAIDGHGNTYVRPIKHVALTDYPLIPGLGGFEKAVAASLSSDVTIAASTVALSENSTMRKNRLSRMASLARRLGVRCADGATDEEIEDQIEAAWTAGEDELDVDPVDELSDDVLDEENEFGAGVDDLDEEDDLDVDMSDDNPFDEEDDLDVDMSDDDPLDEESDLDVGMGEDDLDDVSCEGEDGEFDEDPLDAMASSRRGRRLSSRRGRGRGVAASVASTVVNARRTQLESLARERRITPAQRDQLISTFCDKRRVSIALSTKGTTDGDNFDQVVAAFSMSKPQFRTRSRTGPQHVDNGPRSPIVANAARRAARDKK